jgi:DNA polymerase-3 subunit delta
MAKDLSFDEIKRNVLQKNFAPVYLFQGEEDYFIDQLTDALMENVLTESERDFNQTLLYGSDTDVATIMNAARRFPMMAEKQLVVVREAQNLKNIDELSYYASNPLKSTVLVLNYKHGKLDGRKKLASEINKTGVVFESKKLYDNQIPAFINSYLQMKQVTIDGKSAQLLADYLGVNLNKLTGELEKLCISLPETQRRITPELIERNIGISKDYNNFELQDALAMRDILKVNRIVNYFEANQKSNPLIVTMTVLFNFFSNLMVCHYEQDKSENGIKNALGLRFGFQVTSYLRAMKNYNAFKTMKIISLLRTYDAKSKGFGNPSVPPGELLRELTFKIMH